MNTDRRDTRARLGAVLISYLAVFAAELITALASNSLALLSDSLHVFTDLTGVVLALAAITLAARPASERRSYGYMRLEVLAAFANAGVLLVVGAVVLLEAIRRFGAPVEVRTGPVLVVAVIGLGASVATALLLRGSARGDLNVRAVYLELFSDAVGSIAVIVATLVIRFTAVTGADVVASVVIGALIIPRTWALLRDAVHVLLEGTPNDVEIAHVRQHILDTDGVTDLHDLHVWSITSGLNVISAHVVVRDEADPRRVLRDLARCLSDDFDIAHSTFQLEGPDHRRLEAAAHE